MKVVALHSTVLKLSPLQSGELSEGEKWNFSQGDCKDIYACEVAHSHWRLHLVEPVADYRQLYVYPPHCELVEGEGELSLPPSVTLDVPYKSQLDNRFNPTGACNVTSLAMCLEYLGAERRTRAGQFEDELYEYAIANGYSRHSPYDLAQIARDYGVRDRFFEAGNIDRIRAWVAAGNPNIIHGYFTDFGHIIVVVGYDEYGLIVHDPYGEWFASGYRTDLSGAFLHYSYSLIRRLCMPDGNLWTHYLSR
ncbi:C39 family peptidase [Lyngbya sp. CCY1209]|uniref:C39 family peptidase n=1 Tax=Lyngbya sp. CCY1209 TaxID=2886103 RepID=UPI002D20B498|nr:C39 family peptidase [Lyngbya sp. CCY1209]MEB3884017.1 C39 family peptidase [Lyngbya sp. CCY1209]